MLKNEDLHNVRQTLPIDCLGNPVGTYVIDYDVHRYIDTRNLTSRTGYIVHCTLRVAIPNPSAFKIASTKITGYQNYPILLSQQLEIVDTKNQLAEIRLEKYFPKTINTSVSRSDSTDNSNGITQTNSFSSGSDQSQTNSFSVGFTGDQASGSMDFSSTNSTNSSDGFSEDHSFNHQSSHQDAMTIKDWGAYAQLDVSRIKPGWVWAQEYPWNVLTYNSPGAQGTDLTGIQLPQFVQNRLAANGQALPPSQLSLLGIDFVSKAQWLVIPAAGIIPDEIQVLTSMTYVQGSHDQYADASLTTNPVDSIIPEILDLPLLALDPLQAGARNYAVVGFVPNKFDVIPDGANTFQITSEANDILVRGHGFSDNLSTDFSASEVSITVYFKIDDPNSDINMMFKHWCKNTVGATLTIIVNGDGENPIIRQVNTLEGQTGSVPYETISLRYKDFSSVEYCDLLVMGLNTVTVTITPPSPEGCIYKLLALSVG